MCEETRFDRINRRNDEREQAIEERNAEVKQTIIKNHFGELQDILEKGGYCAGEILAIVDNIRKEILQKLGLDAKEGGGESE